MRESERGGGGFGERSSSWWREMVENVSGEGGRWFWENFEKKFGDGEKLFFWMEIIFLDTF